MMRRTISIVLISLCCVTFAASGPAAGAELSEEQIGEAVNGLFQQLFAVEIEKTALAEKRCNEKSKEQQGRYIVSMRFQQASRLAREMSKDEAEREAEAAKSTMSPDRWRDAVSSINHLNDADRRVFRDRETQLVGKIARLGKRAVPLLIKRIAVPSGSRSAAAWTERTWAQQALTKIGAVAAPELILAVKHKDMRAAEGAVVVLGRIRAQEAIGLLIECLTHKDPSIRGAAAQALCVIGDSRGVPPLVNALKDDSYNVRSAAVRGLESFGDSTCIPALEEMKRTEPSRGKIDLRPHIDRALKAIKDREL